MTAPDGRVYVFAFTEPGLPRTVRMLGRTLHMLPIAAGIDAVVERRTDPVDPTAGALVEQHEILARLARRSQALLPARFGSLVDEAVLRGLAARSQRALREALARTRGRRQMTIRVFGSPDRTIAGGDGGPTGTDYLRARREQLRRMPAEVRTIRMALRSLVDAERVERGRDGMRVAVYHLVGHERIAAYRSKAAALSLEPHRIVVSGPWPAFAFAPDLG